MVSWQGPIAVCISLQDMDLDLFGSDPQYRRDHVGRGRSKPGYGWPQKFTNQSFHCAIMSAGIELL